MSKRVIPMIPLQEHLEKIDKERDLRYQQRAVAQDKAVETALLAAEKAINAALAAQEKAASVAEVRTAKSFEDSNEWRVTYGDRDRLQVPRTEYTAGVGALSDKIDDLGRDRDRGSGRQMGQTTVIAAIIAAIVVAGVIIGILVNLSRVVT